jgi:hypothetical protein
MSHIEIKKTEEQPKRLEYAYEQIVSRGFEIHYHSDTTLKFYYKGSEISVFPYTGWFSGKGIKDGRGIHNLLKQLTPCQKTK